MLYAALLIEPSLLSWHLWCSFLIEYGRLVFFLALGWLRMIYSPQVYQFFYGSSWGPPWIFHDWFLLVFPWSHSRIRLKIEDLVLVSVELVELMVPKSIFWYSSATNWNCLWTTLKLSVVCLSDYKYIIPTADYVLIWRLIPSVL